MTRIRMTAHQLESWDEVDRCLAEIGAVDRDLALLEAAQQESIDQIKTQTKAAAEPLHNKKAGLERAIQQYAEAHRNEFRVTKSKRLTFGTVGYRLASRIVFKRGADVVQALKALGLTHCIRVKEEADKDAMKQLPLETLAECGASLKTEDAFGYEVCREALPTA